VQNNFKEQNYQKDDILPEKTLANIKGIAY